MSRRRARRRGDAWGLWDLPPLDAAGAQALIGAAGGFCQGRDLALDPATDPALWLRHAAGHGLLGLVGGMALEGRVSGANLTRAGREHYFSNMLRHEQALVACRALVEHGAQLDLRFSIMKGPALAADAYGDGGLRGYSDIDLLMASEAEARRLAARLAGRGSDDVSRTPVMRGFAHPGKVMARVQSWDVEIAFPQARPGGPAGELQARDGDRILPSDGPGELPQPEPDAHLLLLIEHLVRHMGERLIWFVDLVVFVRRYGEELDWAWVGRRLKDLGLSGAAGLVARFCREQLDPAFPSALEVGGGTVDPFCAALFSPACVSDGLRARARRHGWWVRFWAMNIQRAGRNWVVTDRTVRRKLAPRWLSALVLNALGWTNRLVCRGVLILIALLGHHGSRFAVWSVAQRVHLDTRAGPG